MQRRGWIFLVNVPIGAGLIALVFRFIAPGSREHSGSTDIAGAVAVTGGLIAIVFAISRSTEAGWRSAQTLASMAVGVVLLAVFVFVEGAADIVARTEGFQRGTLVIAGFGVAAALAAGFLLRPAERASRPPTRPTTVGEDRRTAVLSGDHR